MPSYLKTKASVSGALLLAAKGFHQDSSLSSATSSPQIRARHSLPMTMALFIILCRFWWL